MIVSELVNLKDYLISKGFDPISQGNNYVFNCPACDDEKQKFGIHKTNGKWNCFNCPVSGLSIHSFKKLLRDGGPRDDIQMEKGSKKEKVDIDQMLSRKYHKLLKKKGRKSRKYLIDVRGFSKETIKQFELGSRLRKGHESVSIPFWESGELVNVKFRSLKFSEKKYKWLRIKGGKSSLFNDDIIDDKSYDKLFITEAEMDCISLHNAGVKNTIAVTTGAKGFNEHWFDRLERYKMIYLIFDNDEDGKAGAEKMAFRLGANRCRIVKLPKEYKDLNNYFYDNKTKAHIHTEEDFMGLVKKAKKLQVRDITTLKSALRDLESDIHTADEDQLIGFQTPWKKVNKVMRGVKPGYLVVLSSPPKIGKSTLAYNWCHYLSDQGVPTLFYCCEMKPIRIAEKELAYANPDYDGIETINRLHMSGAKHEAPDNFYLGFPNLQGDGNLGLDMDSLCEIITNSVKRYGLKFVVFDHLHFLVRGTDVNSKIGEVTRRFKLLAESLNIVFVLIVQPKKLGGRMMDTDDFKDSSSIFQDCDLAMLLHRSKSLANNAEVDDNKDGEDAHHYYDDWTIMRLTGRWCEGGEVKLVFDGARSRFYDKGSIFKRAAKKQKEKIRKRKKK